VDLRSQRWSWVALVLLGLVLVAWGASWWITQESPAQSRTPSVSPTGDDETSAVVGGRRVPEATPAPRRPGGPLRMEIPDLGVDAAVLPILAPDGVLTPPSDPQELGWWADGARPGDSRGSALVTGHTVSTGGGALDNLEDLDEGDRILVHSARTESGYAVESVETLAKGDLADRAERLFSQSVPGRLVVVTCEDWNGAEYLSNVVVTATPTTAR
jgi:LPXTG-site transpeptidase (sortase) family protein